MKNNRLIRLGVWVLVLAMVAGGSYAIGRQIALVKNVQKPSISIFNAERTLSWDAMPMEGTSVYDPGLGLHSGEVMAITSEGRMQPLGQEAIWRWRGAKGWAIASEGEQIEGVVGILASIEQASITAVYSDVKERLDAGKRVLVILLDGFSYAQFENAAAKGYVPFLEPHFQHKALSVYTPVTNAGFAAMITGQTPDVNGVHDRSYRDMKVESLFGYALSRQKQAALLEGEIKILNTEIEPLLHIDVNGDGDTDDEMFETALGMMRGPDDLIFVHFHGIDDRGHAFGPNANETLRYIQKVDGYVRQLAELWEGDVILTSDHGMHAVPEGGSHGLAVYEDMIVPYFRVIQDAD